MFIAGDGRAVGGHGRPRIGDRIVASAIVEEVGAGSTPDDHLRARPDCGVRAASGRCSVSGHGRPRIRRQIEARTVVQIAGAVVATPDDHFAAGPDSRVRRARTGNCAVVEHLPDVGSGDVSDLYISGIEQGGVVGR